MFAHGYLVPDDLDQDAFLSTAVEFSVEDLLPGAEVQMSVGYRNDDLAALV